MADWILARRGTKVFKDYSKEQLVYSLTEAVKDNTVYYEATPDDRILGMILAVKLESRKVLFVVENLATNLRILSRFAQKAKEMYPGWTIEAIRHNKLRKFNTPKLFNKLGTI